MTKTEAIIWKRIEEKARRMAVQYNEEPAEREMACWDAHCYKYIDTSGRVNYILSQEEFDKIKFAASLKEIAFELLYCSNSELDPKTKSILNYILNPDFPSFKILKYLEIIQPMWDDREKKKP